MSALPAVSIVINGVPRSVRAATITFERLVELSGRRNVTSIAYSGGTLTRGTRVALTRGMQFSCGGTRR